MKATYVVSAISALLLTTASAAEDKFEGYLCCNMRTDGKWISDINYQENGKTVIPLGTPVKVTGFGRYRVYVEINGKKQALGNDYSRDLPTEAFAKRYVVAVDPTTQLASLPDPIRKAITTGRLTKGMTREQVLMSVGYPITSENPNLDAKIWKFWLSSFAEFRAKFDDQGMLDEIQADADTKDTVVLE